MDSSNKTKSLKTIIENKLTPLINNNYVLLDVPYHSNLGDTLIWQGEIDFLKLLPYKCKYLTWYQGNLKKIKSVINKDTIILLHGGGNFGDIWPDHQLFRKKIIDLFPNNRIIIFPQTIYYSNSNILEEDALFFSKHSKNVIICTRDLTSYQLCQKYFPYNHYLLVPDMAFCMDLTNFKLENNNTKGSIFIRREDKELKLSTNYEIVPKDALVTDWIFLNKSKEYARLKTIKKWACRFDNQLGTDFNYKWKDLYWYYYLRSLNVRTAIQLLTPYAHIYTTRMHAAILSVILGKTDITLFDNSYGKSSSFFYTWLADIDGLRLLK